MPAMMMIHEEEPRDVLWRAIDKIDDVEVLNNDILVCIYERPEKTQGGIIITQASRDEDKTQGKVGMVVKMGAMACKATDGGKWNREHEFALGDLVVFRASDGWAVTVNKKLCRMVKDDDIRMRISHPDQVW